MHRIAVILMLGVLASAADARETLSLEEIVSLKQVTDAAMSPAGERIAYLRSVPRTLYVDADGLLVLSERAPED